MEALLKILMLEDNPDDALLIERVLKKSMLVCKIERVDTREEFIGAIESFCPDVILSDHSLPQFNSIEALKICCAQPSSIPFILVTGTVSEEFAVSALKEGAVDYILKSNLTRLVPAIQNALKQKMIEEERKKAEKSLIEQNAKLIKINSELDRFVYSASHDLRAPLKSVLGLINVAEEDCKASNYEEMLVYHQMMRKSIYKLDMTIREIIDYSRNARNEILREEVDLGLLIDEVWHDLKFMDGLNKISMDKKIECDAPLISDSKRIKIILNNIFSNSIKFQDTEKENRFIRIQAFITNTHLTIVFTDNGIGIGKEYLSKIFDMFYRASEKSDGSGLGLYIVKEAVDKLDGTITVDSKVGSGTSFTLQIPNYCL